MTIPNVVLGELIDPVTFGNAVVDEVNSLSSEIDEKLAVTGGTVSGNLFIQGTTKTNGLNAAPRGESGPTNPNITLGDSGVNAQTGFYRNSTGAIQVACEGDPVARFGIVQLRLYNDLRVDGTIYGTVAFGIAEGIETRDVLDRAETALIPVLDDDERAARTDVERLSVNEVVTALLLKVKELEARLEQLEA